MINKTKSRKIILSFFFYLKVKNKNIFSVHVFNTFLQEIKTMRNYLITKKQHKEIWNVDCLLFYLP